uniref:Disease resistance protein n=1 Tax=Solanum lycopersicum TaxID=4081 RepID=A0A3Q7J134_SOLLC
MEVVVAIGDAFLSSAFDVLIDRLAPEGDLLKMFRKRKNDVELLKKLKLTLLGLQAVLTDAENKQASNQFVREWLNELRHAVDSAENLIEQVNYEALKLKVEGKHQNLAEKILKHCRFCNVCLGDHSFLNINEKLEKTIETLQNLQNQISDLGLQKHFGLTKQETRTPSTSLVDESDVFGRQKEIKDLIDLLLSENASGANLTVVPIVGMGGAGKTTLAKAVYNDAKVKNHFGLKAWYCVSEDYFKKLDHLTQRMTAILKENLKGKKFLVVLDDVWNDTYSEWDNLRNVFVQGDMGSKIIVTTRKASVAQMMCADRCAITVGNLSREDSWALFKRHSLENRDYPELEEIGKKIANKCKGLPLALKALAGVLRGKSEVDEWRNILRSEIWDQQSCWNGILPSLILSYNDLPPHLKRCFAFCAIYPKIMNSSKTKSLFERVPESEWKSEGFVMHDLINDLAQTASSKHCIRLEKNEGSADMLEQSRHMSYSVGEDGDFEKLKQLSESEQLRTLLPTTDYYFLCLSKRVLHNILPRLTSLRALSLSCYVIKELPNDLFIKLKILRFLDLSRSEIEKLPDSICVLYNLETLLLSSCPYLVELPMQMEKLINLRHLDLSYTPELKMPLHLSKLKSLQMLVGAKFLVGGSGGLRMEDLGEVHNLYGSLSVFELQNVVDRREAVKANMKEKEHVEELYLQWSEGSSAYDSQTEREILDELYPYTTIKQLGITGYRGAKFSNWLADPLFLKLVKLSLSDCKDCDSLPALGQLPCLKILLIRGMHGIRELTEEFYGISSSKPFNSLEKLEFENMAEWKQWHIRGSGEFPKLEKLSIENCPELTGKLPENLCSLTELKISGCPQLNLDRSQLEGMKQIVELSIRDCNSVTSLPFSILPSSLKRIYIGNCEKLKLEEAVGCSDMILEELELQGFDCIDDISPEFLPRARKLSVQSCPNLTRFLIPTATESLTIQNCENVEILSVAVDSAMTSLYILNCEKLKCLPEIHLFNLQLLMISDCKKVVNGRKEWCLQRLTELVIYHDGSDEEIQHWELPCSIQRLEVYNLKTLSSQVLKSLTSLQYLCVEGNIPSLVEQGWLPSSLSELHLGYNDELHSLHLSHLTSLIHLHISDCPNLQSLSESALPSSLSELTICSCDNLQSLSESALPSSLSQLNIFDCPNLQFLPVKEMPSSLSKLDIRRCPLLEPLQEFDKGKYWQNIAQIPILYINGESLVECLLLNPHRKLLILPLINVDGRICNDYHPINYGVVKPSTMTS